MKILKISLSIIFILGCVYLLAPSPEYPELTDAVRSDEPGDTWQHPDQKGYYTNLSRSEVINQMQSKFKLNILGIEIPSFRLNYPPEEAQTIIRDQLTSNYLEEIVYPFRESLFVNGWEPKNAPRYSGMPAAGIPEISFRGIPYLSKVTLMPVNSNVFVRLIIWTLTFPISYLVYLSIKKTLSSHV